MTVPAPVLTKRRVVGQGVEALSTGQLKLERTMDLGLKGKKRYFDRR
jgi:hypothetical protein